jgi:hypothetical protein
MTTSDISLRRILTHGKIIILEHDMALNTETANFNPTFRIDKKAGVINFDSTMANEQCILEYIADGMEGGNDSLVSVNKLFEDYYMLTLNMKY